MTVAADPYASAAKPAAAPPSDPYASAVKPPAAPPAPPDPYAQAARQPVTLPKPEPVKKPPPSTTGVTSRVTPTNQQVHGDTGFPSMVHAIGAGITNFAAESAARLKESAADPMGAAQNIEQTPARFMATLLNHGVHRETLVKAFQNAFDPGGGNDEVQKVNDAIIAHMPKTDNPVGKFAEGLLSSFISDPVTYVPIVGWLGKAAKAGEVLGTISDGARAVAGPRLTAPLDRATKAVRDYHAKTVGNVAKVMKPAFGGRPELDPLLEPHAKAAHLGFEHAEISKMHGELGHSDDALLDQNKGALKNVKPTENKGYDLPEPIQQRYLQEPYRYGTPEMRQQALKLGYKPTEADAPWKAKPESVLDYNLREDYQFLGKVSDMSQSPLFKAYGGKGFGEATFEKERTGNWDGLEADQYDRVAARLRMGRDAIRKNRAKNATADYIKHFGGWKGEGPVDTAKLSTDPVRYGGPGRWLSTMAGRSVQGSVLPHAINNVGTLSFLKSPIGTGRAIGYMAKGLKSGKTLTPEQFERIQRMGAMVDYHSEPPGSVWGNILTGGKPGQAVLKKSQEILTQMELSYRQGLLDELDRTLGPSKNLQDEMRKGQEIRDAVVDYRNVPQVVAMMEAVGAPFSPFFGGLTHAVTKALLTHPERIAAVQKVENHAQQDLGFTIPNPVDTYENWLNPGKQLVNRGGPVIGGMASLTQPFIDTPEEIAGGQIERFGGPWASQIPGFFNLPFPEKGTDPGTPTPIEGLLHFLTGAYPYNQPGQYQIKQIERNKAKAENE